MRRNNGICATPIAPDNEPFEKCVCVLCVRMCVWLNFKKETDETHVARYEDTNGHVT